MNFEQTENEFLQKEDSSFDLRLFLNKVKRSWPWFLIALSISLFVGYFLTKTTEPLFRSNAKFFIKEKESALALFEKPAIMDVGSMGLQNEIIILKSKPIALNTLRKLDFDVEYYREGTFTNQRLYKNSPILIQVDWTSAQIINGFISLEWMDDSNFTIEFVDEQYTKFLPDGSYVEFINIPAKTSYAFGDWIETDQFRIRVTKLDVEEEGKILYKIKDVTSLTSYYANNLDVVSVERGASIMNLGITTSNAQMGEAYLNTLMQTYLDLELQDKNEVYSNTIKFIDGQVSGVADTLRFFEKELENYRSENKIYNLSTEGAAVFDQMSGLETQLNSEEFKRKYYQSLKDYLLRENYKELVVPSGIGIDDPILNGLIENLLSLQVDKSRLLATQTEISPAVKEINRKIEDSNRSIREVLKNVDQNSLMLIEDLKSRIGQMDVSFRSLPETEQNLIRIERQFTLSENLYTYLQEKRAEAAITKASNTVNNRIIEPATGGFKITPQPLQNYTVAFLIGILFPLLVIFLKELLRTKIEDLKFLEKRLRIPILSTILLNKSNNSLVVLNQGKSGISEGFRSLRANLKYVLQRDNKISIMVTSTISGEGKTFCAVNLASVYSLTGKKTVLVGCDMRKPKIFGDFQIDNTKGLSTFLSGESNDWKEVVSRSGYENLDILVAGPTPPNPAELLLSARFTSLVDELKKEYDVIIIDTPPVGLVSETLDLLNHVDLTLFVFRQNYSQRAFIDSLNTLKGTKNLKSIYAVFNGVDMSKVNSGYGYSYGYGYGYYEDYK